jgi:hypothetical protein
LLRSTHSITVRLYNHMVIYTQGLVKSFFNENLERWLPSLSRNSESGFRSLGGIRKESVRS